MPTFCVYVDSTCEAVPRIFYVGKGLEKRVRYFVRNALHQNIVRKHGLSRRIVFWTDNESEAFNKERELIALHGTFNDGSPGNFVCNFTRGGEGPAGSVCSAETRLKMSAAHKGRVHSLEWRQNISAAHKGKKLSPEHCAKIGNAKRGKKLSPDHIEKVRVTSTGRKMSDEARAKMSAARIGWSPSEETRAKMRANRLGRAIPQETRDKISVAMSAAMTAAWARRRAATHAKTEQQ